MRIFVVIVTYNGRKWIEHCIGRLKESQVSVTPIVIDNLSTDETVVFIQEHYPEVLLIKNHINAGFGKANNIGILKAIELQADYIFLLNQDAWIEPDTIRLLVEELQRNSAFGLASPVHYNGNGTKLDFNFSYYINPIDTPELISDTFLNKRKCIYKTKFVNAAAWLLSVECIKKVGLFDPLFPHYGEDWDYINRIHYHGFKVGIVPEATIYHDRDSSNYVLNQKRLFVDKLIQLKNVEASFSFNVLNLFVSSTNSMIKLLMFRQFRKFKDEFLTFSFAIKKLHSIKRSYNISRKVGSYLKY
ncbi:glycosyltransferase family 2 protein [Pontibacter chitinilyticus]|uniref:glycosyltransferase family 2 protein n=1 Tax=Pontibacter chitinilyticus TaxID=2674989 RepID=UPI0032196CF1